MTPDTLGWLFQAFVLLTLALLLMGWWEKRYDDEEDE